MALELVSTIDLINELSKRGMACIGAVLNSDGQLLMHNYDVGITAWDVGEPEYKIRMLAFLSEYIIHYICCSFYKSRWRGSWRILI